MFEAEVLEVDAFIASYKSLHGLMPEWRDRYRRKWQIRWPIVDVLGVQRGELCMSCDSDQRRPSIQCLFGQRTIYRLDIVPMTECKPNDLSAMHSGLPSIVCGPHIHGWQENRDYAILNGVGTMPIRKPVDGLVQTLRDGLGWVAAELNIAVSGEQRGGCDLPPQGSLF